MRKLSGLTVLALVVLISANYAIASSPYEITADSIHKHISILASDSLEGRETGEAGEWKAAKYIEAMFIDAGLEPLGDNGSYFQQFEFIKKIHFSENNRIAVNGTELELNEEFQPMLQSADGPFEFADIVPVGYGITYDSIGYDDYEGLDVAGKAVVIKRFAPEPEDTTYNFDRHSSLTDKVINAIDHEVSGVFFVTPTSEDDTLKQGGFTRVAPKDIPIVFIRRSGLTKLGLSPDSIVPFDAAGELELVRVRDTGYNVVGYIPAETDSTMIFGAHYDHLGWGGPGSRYLGKEKKIHYGADDNGSGTAALLELARQFSSDRENLHYSQLFIAFSGEEKGILGSSHFARSMTVDSGSVRMMLNLDMIGRLKEQEKGLAIMGTGTCAEFKDYFDSLPDQGVKLAFKKSGLGPSDHTSFYNRSIPVLFFFTGAHEDYHKPEDVVEKVDFDGIVKVASIASEVANYFDDFEAPLTFQKVKSDNAGQTRRQFSVTMGIMPDFITEVKGLRVDGVSPERPAERAGIVSGDVILKLGDYAIDDIYTYMNCLGKFRKGDTTQVLIERDADTLELQVIFE